MTEPPTTPGDFLRRVSEIQPWKRHDQRAPHKPLLLLLALGRCSRGEERLVSFVEAERHFRELWRRFGPPRSGRAYYPFGRLARKDALWDIPKRSVLRSWHKEDLSPVELRDHDIEGGFPEEVFALLKSDPELALEAAQLILHGHFPTSLHDELLGLEAAHIQWHSHKGPDIVSNGLALCLLHHRALDRGAVGLEAKGDGFRVLVSSQVRWTSPAASRLIDFSGRLIRPPRDKRDRPHAARVHWHTKQVFRN